MLRVILFALRINPLRFSTGSNVILVNYTFDMGPSWFLLGRILITSHISLLMQG